MGERLTNPLGLKLDFDGGYAPGLRPSLVPSNLTLPGPVGTPSWNVATGVNLGREKERNPWLKGMIRREQFKVDLKAMQVKVREAKGKRYLEGLEEGAMKDIPGSVSKKKRARMRTDVADQFIVMWNDLVKAFGARPGGARGDSIGVASAYRSAREDSGAWERSFPIYEAATRQDRLATKDEFGPAALEIIFGFMDGKKAPPGFSGHTHGIAVDLTTTEGGHAWVVKSAYDHQVGWQKTWLYTWLVKHALDYGFYQLKTETWHWEYHGKNIERPPGCWPGKIKERPVHKPRH
jgi:D-alanyl-D-alanine carboxypeptidase